MKAKTYGNVLNYLLTALSAAVTALVVCRVDAPWVLFFSMIPFITAVIKSVGLGQLIKISAVFFYVYYFWSFSFLLQLGDIITASYAVKLLLTAASALLLPAFYAVVHMLPTLMFFRVSKGRIVDALLYACLFTVGEFIISALPAVGFPLVSIAAGTVSLTAFIQSASLFGSLFLTFSAVFINALFAVCISCGVVGLKSVCSALLAVGLFASEILYGVVRINTFKEDGKTVTAAIYQTDVSREGKLSGSNDALEDFFDAADDLTVDMIFFPETALSGDIKSAEVKAEIKALVTSAEAELFIGGFDKDGEARYNAYFAFSDEGEFVYRKLKLVPFGEYSFFSDTLFDGTKGLTAAEEVEPIRGKIATVAVGVCSESIYPSLIRRQVKNDAELIAVPTNDSWFSGSHLQGLHFRHSILRSVENARYCVRSANSGISAVISPLGKITASLPEGESGIIKSSVTLLSSKTLYTVCGNLWLLAPAVGFFYAMFFNIRQLRKAPKAQA